MISEQLLMRSAERVNRYIDKYVDLVGAENKEEVLDLFDSMHRLFPHWVIGTCPKMHPSFAYVSKNGPFVFGYTHEELLRISRMDNYFNYVHDADHTDLYDCFAFLHDTLEAIPPEEHYKYRVVLHYRFRKANGQYVYMHDEKASLHLSGAGNLYYALMRDISEERVFAGVKLELYLQENMLVKIKEYKPAAQRNALSKRETELITLIRQGLSTKEIAWYLKISQYTVRNIKSRMFEKFNVNNSIELINMAGQIT